MKQSVFCGLVLVTLGVATSGSAQDTEWNRYTLEDLGGVFVRIEVGDACAAAGITASSYEADVSLKLIESEVGVLTQGEMLENPAMPELRASLECASGTGGVDGSVAWSVGLRVQQVAQMLRDTQITLPESVTWYSTDLGISTSGAVTDALGASLMAEIEKFVEAWTSANAEEAEVGND
mgnify:FL=1